MRRAETIRRCTLSFLAFGPVIGGLCMFIDLVSSMPAPVPLMPFFTTAAIWVIVFHIIGGYVVGALPAAAAGAVFGLVASRRRLSALAAVLLGAGAGLLTSVLCETVLSCLRSGVPLWNWIVPGIGTLAGALCGTYCWFRWFRNGTV